MQKILFFHSYKTSQSTFLYSKFSQSCKNFTQRVRKSGITFFQYVNIDDKNSRTVLKTVNIKEIPCIVVIYDTGDKEVFQGRKAYDWFNSVVRSIEEKKRQDAALSEVTHDLNALEAQTGVCCVNVFVRECLFV